MTEQSLDYDMYLFKVVHGNADVKQWKYTHNLNNTNKIVAMK